MRQALVNDQLNDAVLEQYISTNRFVLMGN